MPPARLIEYNSLGVRLYWTGHSWELETPARREALGDIPAESAISLFDHATREATRKEE